MILTFFEILLAYAAQRARMSIRTLIERLPKAELHVHIEGCLEPDLVLKLAERNNLQHKLPYKTLAEAEAAFQYDNLQEFLDLRDATLQVTSR